MSLGITKLAITNDFRIYPGKDDPQLATFEQLEQTYDKQDTLYFFLELDQDNIFNKQVFELNRNLTEPACQQPCAERVN